MSTCRLSHESIQSIASCEFFKFPQIHLPDSDTCALVDVTVSTNAPEERNSNVLWDTYACAVI